MNKEVDVLPLLKNVIDKLRPLTEYDDDEDDEDDEEDKLLTMDDVIMEDLEEIMSVSK